MKSLILAAIVTFTCHTVYGQLFFHDVDPDTTVDTWNAFQVRPSSSPTNDITIWWHPTPEVVVQTHGDCEILFAVGGFPAKLASGDSVSASGTWNTGSYDPLSSGSNGNWQTAATDKYLGFRFKNATTTWYYGWLKMSVAAGAASFTVKEWAYNTTGGSIKAGQTTSTTSINAVSLNTPQIAVSDRTINITKLDKGVTYMAELLNAGGEVVLRALDLSIGAIDAKGLAPGMYILRISANGMHHCFRVPLL